MRNWILQLGLAVVGGFVLLLGLVSGGRAARDTLRQQERYLVEFLDIDCPAPARQERGAFLSEVQYLAAMPSRLSLLEEHLPARLAAAFARHPWVDRVERVELTAPPQVRVKLRFRKPVLAVFHGDELRAVDRHGILLPKDAHAAGLPLYAGHIEAPLVPAGTRWGGDAVADAARTAAGRKVRNPIARTSPVLQTAIFQHEP
jgi:hypothetical protein